MVPPRTSVRSNHPPPAQAMRLPMGAFSLSLAMGPTGSPLLAPPQDISSKAASETAEIATEGLKMFFMMVCVQLKQLPLRTAVRNHLGRDEYHHFTFRRLFGLALEKIADHRDIAQERDFVFLARFFHLENAANHHRSAVLDQDLCFDVLGIDGDTLGCGFTTAVLAHVQIQNDVAFRGDLRRDL